MLTADIDQFITYLHIHRNYSPLTCDAYRRDLKRFAAYLESHDIIKWDAIQIHDVETYLVHLADQKLCAASRNRALAAIQSFYKFLRYEGICRLAWVELIPKAKLPERIPDTLTYKEFKAIIKAIPHSSYYDHRDRALLELLYGSGLRISEACNLEAHQLFDDHIRVIGKGNKERIVPITRHFVKAFRKFWKDRASEISSPREKVFGLDRIAAWHVVKKRAAQAGITKRINPHMFRHSCASELLRNGADLRIVQEILGHKHLNSTTVYLHLSDKDLLRKFRECHWRW